MWLTFFLPFCLKIRYKLMPSVSEQSHFVPPTVPDCDDFAFTVQQKTYKQIRCYTYTSYVLYVYHSIANKFYCRKENISIAIRKFFGKYILNLRLTVIIY